MTLRPRLAAGLPFRDVFHYISLIQKGKRIVTIWSIFFQSHDICHIKVVIKKFVWLQKTRNQTATKEQFRGHSGFRHIMLKDS